MAGELPYPFDSTMKHVRHYTVVAEPNVDDFITSKGEKRTRRADWFSDTRSPHPDVRKIVEGALKHCRFTVVEESQNDSNRFKISTQMLTGTDVTWAHEYFAGELFEEVIPVTIRKPMPSRKETIAPVIQGAGQEVETKGSGDGSRSAQASQAKGQGLVTIPRQSERLTGESNSLRKREKWNRRPVQQNRRGAWLPRMADVTCARSSASSKESVTM